MKIYNYTPNVKLIDAELEIDGHEGTLGVYIIQDTRVALIDTGPAASLPRLFSILKDLQVKPESVSYILATHIHLDHLGGLGQALRYFPNARCVVNEKGIKHLLNPQRLWEGSVQFLGEIALKYGKPEPVAADRLIAAKDGLVFDLGNVQIEVLVTPGHAPHHLSFVDRQRKKLFPGEAAGIYFPDTGLARPASPPPFDLRQTLTSLDKLIATQPQDIYFSHYGSSGEAAAILKDLREQVILWGKVVARNMEGDPQLVTDEILSLDKTREQIYSFSQDRLNSELYFLNNNVRGYREYFQKEGLGLLDELGN